MNPTIGAIDANAGGISRAVDSARERGADLVVTPELSICGYPPKDLLLREGFVERCREACDRVGRASAGVALVLGCPVRVRDGLANALLLYERGELVEVYEKRLLPTYDVFDEDRYFMPGTRAVVREIAGVRVGLSICEDLWRGEDAGFSSQHARDEDPVVALVREGARVIVNPSASPFVLGKGRRHIDLLRAHATRHGVFVASTNQVGGNDELIFDGHARVFDPSGGLVACGAGFEEQTIVVEIDGEGGSAGGCADLRVEASAEELIVRALVLGVRDYCRKTGFARVVLGLSGGIDSAVVAVIARAALGAENVTCLAMPGKYSSAHSLEDARELACRLGVRLVEVPIEDAFEGARRTIDRAFAVIGAPALGASLPDVAEENLQSRIRGMLVMAHANRTGDLPLTTGNKSELAVGYCTLYGDMNGGLAVLSDVLKTRVYAIARFVNGHPGVVGCDEPPIPQGTILKPPSAELAPNQLDSDTLPTYDVLDPIIEGIVERGLGEGSLVAMGHDREMVRRVARMIDRSEYKRKQLATGLKITGTAFGFGRRMPIAQGWV